MIKRKSGCFACYAKVEVVSAEILRYQKDVFYDLLIERVEGVWDCPSLIRFWLGGLSTESPWRSPNYDLFLQFCEAFALPPLYVIWEWGEMEGKVFCVEVDELGKKFRRVSKIFGNGELF